MAVPKLPVIFIVVGSAICIFALIFGFKLFPAKYEAKIWEQFKLENGTDKWEKWRVTPIPVYQTVYLFNVTNPSEVIQGSKPILQEVGPYVFRQYREKVDIIVNDEKDTISYKHFDVYHYVPEKSKGALTDVVTVPNLPYIGAVAKAMKMPTSRRYFVQETLSGYPKENLYVTRTVDEYLFGGYFVPFMKELSELSGEVLLPNHTFGLYYAKNGTRSSEYEIYSGVKDPSRFGQVVSFGNNTEMPWGYGPECNKIIGSDGVSTPPFMKPDRVFYMFVPGVCRSLRFEFESEVNHLGIPGYRFTVPKDFLGDARSTPENRCYCSGYPSPQTQSKSLLNDDKEKGDDDGFEDPFEIDDGFGDPFGEDEEESSEETEQSESKVEAKAIDSLEYLGTCPKEGVWELAACRKGTPLIMSYPHFYLGSEEYLNQSVGMNPTKEKHQLIVELEPNAVIPLQIKIRVQMNIAIEKNKVFKPMKNIPDMVHPIFWMDQGVALDAPMAQLVKDKLIRTKELAILAAYCMFGLGCVCIVTGVMIFICRASSAKRATQYSLKKHSSTKRNSSYSNGDMIMDSPSKPQKFATIAQSPPTLYRQNTEETRPFLPPRNEVAPGAESNPMSNGINGRLTPTAPPTIIRTSSPPTPVPTPTPPPRIVTMYPKISDVQLNNSPYQMNEASDEVDGAAQPEHPYSPMRSSNALGDPFPSTKEFSSTNSVDNAIKEMDSTLKGIHDTLSSYENL